MGILAAMSCGIAFWTVDGIWYTVDEDSGALVPVNWVALAVYVAGHNPD